MLIGYARVSTDDQKLDLQEDALQKAGCARLFRDIISGAKAEREGLTEAINHLREGDTLVVWKLDRLGRSLKQLIEVVGTLQNMKVHFKSLQEAIDTTTPGGQLVFHIFAAMAQFERELIRERTNAGLKAARARGRIGGRPRRLSDKQIAMAKSLLSNPDMSIKDVCSALKVSRATLYRYVKIQKI